MDGDFIRGLGPALTAHRLRRAGDTLADSFAAIFAEQGIDIPGRSGSTLLLLAKQGPLPVTEIARQLRFTHPLIVRMTGMLVEAGLATAQQDPRDLRRKLIALTARGKQCAARLHALNHHVAAAYLRLFDEIDADLIALLDQLESALARRGIADRVRDELGREIEENAK